MRLASLLLRAIVNLQRLWSPGGHRLERRPRRAFTPRLELLEDRSLPSTFSVLNTADSGLGSLRQAVLDANDNPGLDVIEFAPDVTGTIPLTSGELAVTGDLIIAGPGAERLAVSGSDVSRVFNVGAGVNV